MPSIQRRHILELAATLPVLGAVTGPSPALAAELPAGPAVCAVFGSAAEMRRIGSRWLDLHPEEIDPSRQWLDALNAAGRVCNDQVRHLVAGSVQVDLDRAEMVVLDGWVVPRALARTCSALSLG
ncbi:hypothetical protein [Azospirillum sp. sgz301742]